MLKNKRGFTLLELLAVLVILAALATIAIPIFMNKGDTARNTANAENLRIIQDAISRYEWEKGTPLITDTAYYTLLNQSTHKLIADGYLTAVPTQPYAGLTTDATKRNLAVYVIGRDITTGSTTVKLVLNGSGLIAPTLATALAGNTVPADQSKFLPYGTVADTTIRYIDGTGTVKSA
ncbi:MAG TPA: hypothetical protein DEP72_00105 [Clostridiales bacterium]|nr:MAG: hypothetical protein A2Y18_08355 [Clostridiales bacterium GWD2_32_19]HCC06554.1 hypothetical protein [Clostridiales bacterium]